MRTLPYSKRLLELQRERRRPWLVVICLGWNSAWRASYRRLIAPDDDGVVRLWWPADLAPEAADLAVLTGTDVLLAECDGDLRREGAIVDEVWKRGAPATLWVVRHPDRKWLHLAPAWAKFRAVRVYETPVRLLTGSLVLDGLGQPIDQGLREHIAATREFALFMGDRPLFHRPEFLPAREKDWRRHGLDLQCLERRRAA